MGHLVLCVQRGPPPTEHFFKKGVLSIVTMNACSWKRIHEKIRVCTGKWVCPCTRGVGYCLLNERVPYRVFICKLSHTTAKMKEFNFKILC